MGNDEKKMIDLAEAAGWQVAASEKSYLLVRRLMRKAAADLQQALVAEEQRYRSRAERENKRHQMRLEQLKNRHLVKPNQEAADEYNGLESRLRKRKDSLLKKVDTQLDDLQIRFRDVSVAEKVAGFLFSRQDSAQLTDFETRRTQLNQRKKDLEEDLQRTLQRARKVMDEKTKQNGRVFDRYRDDEVAEHRLLLENIENEHRNNESMLLNVFEQEFARYFNTAAFSTVYDMAGNRMRGAVGYIYSDRIPETMYLGVRTFSVTNGTEGFMPGVVNMFRRIGHRAVTVNGRTVTVSLPFFRTIEEGYSVYLEVPDAAAPEANQIVWDYVMKVLMNFPAGQTRPLLLDSDSTTELTDFGAIGDSSGRNLTTRPWTREKDIELELQKLAMEHSNLTISYGKDVASRMLREPIYTLACRNFPKGISQGAMVSLSNVLSAGAARGFFGIVQASTRELANRKKEPEFSTLLDSLKKVSLCVKASNGRYRIADSEGEDLFEFERMSAAEANKRSILSQLIAGMTRYSRQIEKFEYLFSKDAGNVEGMDMHNLNTWFRGDASSRFEVPIGISGASTVQKYAISGVAQHGLISGVTGSGKSTLLKTIIMASMMKYTPDNLNMYLIDFKEGVEFATFSEYKLPWIKAIALNTERVFALNILKHLQKEFERRANAMRENTVTHIKGVRSKFPRILLIFDEVQELLRIDDDITRECVNILSFLVSEGRAMNINLIMASQNFAACRGIDTLKANMAIRIALKGSPDSARIVMGEGFDVEQLEQGDSGAAAINTASGARGQTTFFQVGYLENGEVKDLLSKLSMTMNARRSDTRVMSVYASQDRGSKFNRLITDGEVVRGEKPENYELMLGDEFVIDRRREINIGTKDGENLMVVGESEVTAKAVFALSALSLIYGELAFSGNPVDRELIRLVDMSDEYEVGAEYLQDLAGIFGRQINRVTGEDTDTMIDDTYTVLMDRKRGRADSGQRLFLMIFGMDSIQCLQREMFSEDDGELSRNKKLLRLLQEGPRYGINCILWARTWDGFQEVVDSAATYRCFNKRIYFGPNEEAQKVLGIKYDMSKAAHKTVACRDMSKAMPNMFRVFELPNPAWVESIADACRNFGRGT